MHKIEKYGKIKDIFVRQIGPENKNIQFTMERISEARFILSEFSEHSDEYGRWSSCKRVQNSVT